MSIANWILGTTGVSTIGGIVWTLRKLGVAIKFMKQHKPQIDATYQEVLAIKDHVMKNLPAVEIGQIMEQAATIEPGPDAADLRRAKIAAVLNLLPQAAGVEIAKLKEPAVAPVIAKILNDHLPELGGSITPEEVTGLLNAGEEAVDTLRNHDLLRTVLQVLACVEPATASSAAAAATTEAPTLTQATQPIPQ